MADAHGDAAMSDFVEGSLLADQVSPSVGPSVSHVASTCCCVMGLESRDGERDAGRIAARHGQHGAGLTPCVIVRHVFAMTLKHSVLLLTKIQVESVKKVSEYVSQLRRVGKGLGVFQFDRALADELKA